MELKHDRYKFKMLSIGKIFKDMIIAEKLW